MKSFQRKVFSQRLFNKFSIKKFAEQQTGKNVKSYLIIQAFNNQRRNKFSN